MPVSPPRRVLVQGLPLLDLSPAELTALLSSLLAAPPAGLALFTPNATIGAVCCRDDELRALICQGELLLPDGAGILLASRRACPEHPLRHRLPGIEAGECVLQLCADRHLPVYFLGGRPGIAEEAARSWCGRLPALSIAGCHHGYFPTDSPEEAAILSEIRNSRAAVVLVCLGFPRQERWILGHRAALPEVRLFMALGGSLDVWAGRIRRAPRLFQRIGCEWLWRMLREPRRIAALPAMLGYVLRRPPPKTW